MSFGTYQRQLDMAALTLASKAASDSAEAIGRIERHERDCIAYRETMREELSSHRQDVTKRLDKQDQSREAMHAQNQKKFDQLFRALYIGLGIILAAMVFLTHNGLGEAIKFFLEKV